MRLISIGCLNVVYPLIVTEANGQKKEKPENLTVNTVSPIKVDNSKAQTKSMVSKEKKADQDHRKNLAKKLVRKSINILVKASTPKLGRKPMSRRREDIAIATEAATRKQPNKKNQ